MSRRDFETHLRAHGCSLHRNGAKHDIWRNSITGSKSPVPRHKTLKTPLVRGVCRKLGIPVPSGV